MIDAKVYCVQRTITSVKFIKKLIRVSNVMEKKKTIVTFSIRLKLL